MHSQQPQKPPSVLTPLLIGSVTFLVGLVGVMASGSASLWSLPLLLGTALVVGSFIAKWFLGFVMDIAAFLERWSNS